MKKQIKVHEAGIIPASNSHDLNAVTDRGSSCSTQVWHGGVVAVAQRAIEWYAKGEAGRAEENPWNDPIIHVFIYSHKLKETWHYDMGKQSHIEDLRKMAIEG